MMLPSVPKSLGRLSDVFISALGAITGNDNRLRFPRVKSACVILVDGLGSANIEFRAGHAPTIANQLKLDESIFCGFPSTTVASLASFSTGSKSGKHGMVGYQVFDRQQGLPVNLLTGIADLADAKQWQPMATVSEVAKDFGIPVYFVGPAEYEGSGFTNATMRGAKYVAGKSIEDRFRLAAELMNSAEPNLVYLYVPELDQKAHAHGFKSAQWVEKLEDLDSALKRFLPSVPNNCGVILTADHGIIDVDPVRHVYLDELPLRNLVAVGGDPRVLFLYFENHEFADQKSIIQEFLGKKAYVAEADELVSAGWFGEVDKFARDRMPDLFLISIAEIAMYHRNYAKTKSLQMIGQHGSISTDELKVPLLKFRGFAKK
jgi:predicted AlkP superfamily pyrophosphatase or phosphodiesterase